MTVIDPGRVVATLLRDEGRGEFRLAVTCSRPEVAAILRHRDVETVRSLIPAMFGVCGKAQGLAADLAIAAARGFATPGAIDREVAGEAAREHAWRLILDWPERLGERRDLAQFANVVRAIQASHRCAWPIPPWIDGLGQEEDVPCRRLLPALNAEESAQTWPRLDAGFARFPLWRGAAAETGAFARAAGETGTGVRARVLARAEELQRHLDGRPTLLGLASGATLAPGVGRSTVETARGLLMHEVELAGDVVERYVVVAPTEWNFHPGGMLDRCLSATEGVVDRVAEGYPEDQARRRAAQWILAMDPCVAWTIEDGAQRRPVH